MLSLMCCYALTPLETMLFPDYKVFFFINIFGSELFNRFDTCDRTKQLYL